MTMTKRWLLMNTVLVVGLMAYGLAVMAQEPPKPAAPAAAPAAVQEPAKPAEPPKPPTTDELADTIKKNGYDADTLWTLVTAFLVFWMQAGFAMVETGLTRSKNAVHICMKNLLDFSFGTIFFWLIGFGIMFGTGSGFLGTSGFALSEAVPLDKATESMPATFASLSWTSVSLDCKFLFQLVFAATAATIVSGAMAERTKFSSYLVYSIAISAIIYPVSGHWIWGGGWLSTLTTPMKDFAGSTVVHSVGGWIALAGAIMLGPRIGKYGADGRVNAIPGHNYPLMILGVFILWLGWFGFNPGSTMAITGYGALASHIAVTTNMAAATGTVGALLASKMWFGKWDGSMAGNGALAGLVAITCPCAWVDNWAAALIGLIAGVLVVASVVFIDRKLRIDDPVGAVSVHLVCGIWGTLSLGIFSNPVYGDSSAKPGLFFGGGMDQLISQAIGVVTVGVWCLVTGFILFSILKAVIGLRVSQEEEMKGLDVDEHGMMAYPDFQAIAK
jgi:Amt family ammonium transporter